MTDRSSLLQLPLSLWIEVRRVPKGTHRQWLSSHQVWKKNPFAFSRMNEDQGHSNWNQNVDCWLVGCLLACLTSQEQTSESQGRICSDICACCHTGVQVVDRSNFPSDPVPALTLHRQAPGRVVTTVPIFKSLVWLDPHPTHSPPSPPPLLSLPLPTPTPSYHSPLPHSPLPQLHFPRPSHPSPPHSPPPPNGEGGNRTPVATLGEAG